MFAEAFRAYLIADTVPRTGGLTCRQRLGPYDSGPGGDGLSIFVTDPPPEKCWANIMTPNLFTVTITEQGGDAFDVRDITGKKVQIQVIVRGSRGFTAPNLCDMSFDVRDVFHRSDVYVPNYENWGVFAEEPVDFEDALGFPAYRISMHGSFLSVVPLASTTSGGGTTSG